MLFRSLPLGLIYLIVQTKYGSKLRFQPFIKYLTLNSLESQSFYATGQISRPGRNGQDSQGGAGLSSHPLDPPVHQPGVSKLDGSGQTRLEFLGSGYQGQGGDRKPARACLVVAGGPGRLHRLHQSRRGRLVDGEALLTLSIEIWFKIIVSV